MMINSVSSYSPFANANISGISSSSSQSSTTDQTAKTSRLEGKGGPGDKGGPGGPGGKGGPGGPEGAGGGKPPAQKTKGPNLDTDNDNNWSEDELEEYAKFSSQVLGISLDTDDIMSLYDTDGDGIISEAERNALASDNAFKLPKPEEISNNITESKTTGVSLDDSETQSVNANIMEKFMNAYTASKNYSSQNLISMFDSMA